MDRILKITLGVFITILVVTTVFAGYNGYVTKAYQSTLTSSYVYTLNITTDSSLANVTLFIPVPADRSGNSPVVAQFSSHEIPGIPASWQTTLFDTGKATLVKIHIPALIPPEGTGPENPYTVALNSELQSETTIDTADPLENSPVFDPIQELRQVTCTKDGVAAGERPECFTFLTSLYADYSAKPDTTVTITTSITGKNNWSVFDPKFNEYTTVIILQLQGEKHGWAPVKGTMVSRIGSYDDPFRTS